MLRSTLMTIRTENAALAVALVDAETGLCVEHDARSEPDVERDIASNAAQHSRLWRVARAHRSSLRLRGPIECIVVTEATVVHLLRPIDARSSLVLYAVVERSSHELDALVAALGRAAEEIARRSRRAEPSASDARARSA